MHVTRIARSGNTLTVELPEDLTAELGLSEGQEVTLERVEDGAALIIWLSNGHIDGAVDPDRARRIDAIIERRRAMLESLAQR